jgi:hypothetical protein
MTEQQRKVRDRRIIRQRSRGASIRQIAAREKMTVRGTFLAIKRLEPQIVTALKRSGYDLHRAITDMVEMTRANETRLFVIDGQIVERQVPDNPTRLKARTRLLNLHVGDDSNVPNRVTNYNGPMLLMKGFTDERLTALRNGSKPETISIEAHERSDENSPESDNSGQESS